MKAFAQMLAGALVTFAAMFAASAIATLSLPSVSGPFLGDQNVNLFSVATAIRQNNGMSGASQVANATTQALCTVIATPIVQFTTVASSGAACLPPAGPGAMVLIANEGGQTLQLFGSNSPNVPGTQDTINTTTGSTAYAHPTNSHLTICFVEAAGAWRCTSDL